MDYPKADTTQKQKANKNFVGARIPQDLYNHYEAYLEQTGQKPTQLITAALSAYLNFPLTKSQNSITIDNERFHSLEDRVIALELALREIQLQNTPPATSVVIEPEEQANVINSDIEADNKDNQHFFNTSDQENDSSISVGDNIAEQSIDNSNTHNQLSIINESTPDIVANPTKKTLKTNEIPNLPGLENLDSKKIKSKLGNTKNKTIKTTKIGNYKIEFSHQEPGSKGSIFWNVIENS
ncbi:hypothetical protein QT972_32295 [Microcoleus sp. herbarium7]|uniref:hypothetical protein n=1 Tax=Microcoleus sp. herbarium7 TaxID=3055435 RepID=UPI002FCFAA06